MDNLQKNIIEYKMIDSQIKTLQAQLKPLNEAIKTAFIDNNIKECDGVYMVDNARITRDYVSFIASLGYDDVTDDYMTVKGYKTLKIKKAA